MPVAVPLHSGALLTPGTVDIAALKVSQVGSTGAGKVLIPDGSNRIQLADGSGNSDAATVGQMNAAITASAAGLTNKGTAQALATTNIASLSGTQTAGGLALSVGDIIVAAGQTTPTQKGPWVVAAGAWTRPANYANASVQKPNTFWTISGGTYADTVWWISSDTDVVVGTDSPTITAASLFIIPATAVTPGSYTFGNFTVGADGRITAASTSTFAEYPFTATASQTSFATHASLTSVVSVTVNGIAYNPTTNYTVNMGTGVFTLPACTVGDDVMIKVWY